MNKKIAIELIKLEVLNLCNSEDSEALHFLKRNDENFPWKELGEYQSLVSLLSITPETETPREEIKLKMLEKARRIKNIKSPEIKPEISEPVEAEINEEINKTETNSNNLLSKLKSSPQGNNGRRDELAEEQGTNADDQDHKEEEIDPALYDFILLRKSRPFRLNDNQETKPDEPIEGKPDPQKEEDKFEDKPDDKPEDKIKAEPIDEFEAAHKEQFKEKEEVIKKEEFVPEEINFNDKIEVDDKTTKDDEENTISNETDKLEPVPPEDEIKFETAPVEDLKKSFQKDIKPVYKPRRRFSLDNSKRGLFIIAVLIIIAVPLFLFLGSSEESVKEPLNHENLTLSNKPLPIKDKEGVVVVEDIEQVDDNENEIKEKASAESETEKVNLDQKKQSDRIFIPPPPEPLLDDPAEVIEDLEKTENAPIEILNIEPPPKDEIIEEEPGFFIAVEEMPEPIGGIKEIQKKVVYPKIASLAGVEGKVIVQAFVDETGKVIDAVILKGIGSGCDEAAMDAVYKTRFKPGKQRGKPVKVKVSIPIVFKK